MWLLRRAGNPFLLLPDDRRLAAKGLGLYSAQTKSARLAKTALRIALLLGMKPRLERIKLRPASGSGFATYLARGAGLMDTSFPRLALLAGNPRARGRRCVLLVFDGRGTPATVVKAGSGEAAQQLISQEESFLKSAPPKLPGIPLLKSTFSSKQIRALTMDYLQGDIPPTGQIEAVGQLLSSWILPGPTRQVRDLAVWRRLQDAHGGQLPASVQKLAEAKVRPVVFHGDFAPWNIKVQAGTWTALDWERGELNGMPLWDWLHFVVQPALLVQRASTQMVLDRIEELFGSGPFRRYAEQAGILGLEHLLSWTYLQYCIHVVAQTEGLPQVQALAVAASRKNAA
jgi:hypothetical protein